MSVQETAIATTVVLLAKYFQVPMVQVNVLDADHQVTIAAVGTPIGLHQPGQQPVHPRGQRWPGKLLADIDPLPATAAHINA